MLSQLSALLPLRSARPGSKIVRFVALLTLLAITLPTSGQTKYTSAEDAYNVGAAFINAGNLAAARDPLEAALKLAKTDSIRMKVNQALMVPYRELPEIEPMQKAAEYVIANSKQAAERSLTRRSLLAFIHRRGKMNDAVEGYEARLKKMPDDQTVLYVLAEAYATYKSDPTRSAEVAQKLATLEKKSGKKLEVREQAQLAQQYVKAGKLKEAAELYEQIAPIDPKLEAWHLKEAAAAWLKAGDRGKAVTAAKKSAAAAPEQRNLLDYFWRRGLGDVFLDSGEPALAIPHYEQAIVLTKIDGYAKDTKAKLLEAQAAAKK